MFDDTHRALAPLALLAVVSLAGCTVAGLPVGAPAPYTETGAALDGDALAEDHAGTLDDAGSFRSTTNVSLAADGETASVERAVAVGADDRARSTRTLDSAALEGDGLVVTGYTDNETTARRVVLDGDDGRVVHYGAARAPYDDGLLAVSPVEADRAAQTDLVAAAADEVEWTQRGVERHDGTWITRYEASGPENVSDVGLVVAAALADADAERTGVTPEDVDATAANATMLVTGDGTVRALSLTVVGTTEDGDPVEVTVTLAVDDVGATDVQRPDWYGEATDDLEG